MGLRFFEPARQEPSRVQTFIAQRAADAANSLNEPRLARLEGRAAVSTCRRARHDRTRPPSMHDPENRGFLSSDKRCERARNTKFCTSVTLRRSREGIAYAIAQPP